MSENMFEKQRVLFNLAKRKPINIVLTNIIAILTSTQVTFSLFCENPFIRTISLLSGILTSSIGLQIRNQKLLKDKDKLFIEELKDSDQYKTCKKEYEALINDLATIIKYLKIEDPKEIIVFYQELLINGLLSKRSEETKKIHHEYHLYEHELNPMEELCGARVASGKTVCRHRSAMLIDLLKKLGVKACNISTQTVTEEEAKKLIKIRTKKYTHSVVGIIEGENKYIFDPTHDSFAVVDDNPKTKNSLATKIEDENASYCYYLSKEYKLLNRNFEEIRVLFDKTKKSSLSKEELIGVREKIDKLSGKNRQLIMKFYLNEEPRLNKIAELESMLCPKGDNPLEEWILK